LRFLWWVASIFTTTCSGYPVARFFPFRAHAVGVMSPDEMWQSLKNRA